MGISTKKPSGAAKVNIWGNAREDVRLLKGVREGERITVAMQPAGDPRAT
jgi:hypothetical protein